MNSQLHSARLQPANAGHEATNEQFNTNVLARAPAPVGGSSRGSGSDCRHPQGCRAEGKDARLQKTKIGLQEILAKLLSGGTQLQLNLSSLQRLGQKFSGAKFSHDLIYLS